MADTDELMSAAERAAMAELNEMDAPAAEDARKRCLPPKRSRAPRPTRPISRKKRRTRISQPKRRRLSSLRRPWRKRRLRQKRQALAVDPVAEDVDDDRPVYLPVTDVAPLKESLTKAEADLRRSRPNWIPATFRRLRLSASRTSSMRRSPNCGLTSKGSEQAVKANQAAAERYVDRSRSAHDGRRQQSCTKGFPGMEGDGRRAEDGQRNAGERDQSYAWMLREADRIARAMVNAPRKSAEAPAAQAPAPTPPNRSRPLIAQDDTGPGHAGVTAGRRARVGRKRICVHRQPVRRGAREGDRQAQA